MKCVILMILCAGLALSAPTDSDESHCGSPLLCGIYNDQEDVVLTNQKIDGSLKIHFEAISNELNMVDILIEKKPDTIDSKVDGKEYTSLVEALHSNASEDDIISLIKRGADVNAKDEHGQTPLHFCAGEDKEDIARLLIKNNANVNVKDENGDTPLHFSAINGTDNIAKLLIESGADINATNNEKSTPLHDAASNGNVT